MYPQYNNNIIKKEKISKGKQNRSKLRERDKGYGNNFTK
jgi:hypothetical protein